jgi:hypothetical protein
MIEAAPESFGMRQNRRVQLLGWARIFLEVAMAKEKVNVFPQEGPGKHSGKRQPKNGSCARRQT